MPKSTRIASGFKVVSESAPRFLLFLKTRGRRRPLEGPAKSNGAIEAGVLIVSCLVLVAIAMLVFHVLRHS